MEGVFMPRHRLTDDQWEAIADLFPKPARTGRPPSDPRLMVDGIVWILRTGSPWRDLPEDFGPWKTVWDHFDKWNANGLLDAVLNRLRASHVDVGAIDDELWCIDGTVVRAARCAAGGGKKGTPTSRKTTRWAAREAVFRQRSICSATVTATRCTSRSQQARRTSRRP
jgi:transposase